MTDPVRSLAIDHVTLAYRSIGSGPAVLCIQGVGCSSTSMVPAGLRTTALSFYGWFFNGPAAFRVCMTMPVGNAVVPASSKARASVPSAKSRFPLPNRTG